jgi:hypothetical protein
MSEIQGELESLRDALERLKRTLAEREKQVTVTFYIAYLSAHCVLTVEEAQGEMRVEKAEIFQHAKDKADAESMAHDEALRLWPESDGYYEHREIVTSCTARLGLEEIDNPVIAAIEALQLAIQGLIETHARTS